jgi:CRP-like cAMP-binding protein
LTAIAEESTKVYFFDKALLHTLCLENPSFAMTALKVIGQRVRTLTELVEELSLCEVDMRLAHFLLSEAQRRGERVNGHIHLDLNLTRSQIATRIGTVREVVSRKLVQMQSEGLIELEKRHLTIKDPERFQQYAKAGKK